jgi:hypothetical protein
MIEHREYIERNNNNTSNVILNDQHIALNRDSSAQLLQR